MTVRIKDGVFHADGQYGVEDELTVRWTNGGICLRIDEPWAGDTNTGFGRECSIDIPTTDAIELRDFLLACFPVDAST